MAVNQQEINKLKSDAVMEFVNIQVQAHYSGFVDGCECSLYSLYRFAQTHSKDSYKIEVPSMIDVYGIGVANYCRSQDEGEISEYEMIIINKGK